MCFYFSCVYTCDGIDRSYCNSNLRKSQMVFHSGDMILYRTIHVWGFIYLHMSSATFVIIPLFDSSYPSGCEMVSLWGFDWWLRIALAFCWWLIMYSIFSSALDHFSVFFGKNIFNPLLFLNWVVWLSLSYKRS